jgi:hypothetical protein
MTLANIQPSAALPDTEITLSPAVGDVGTSVHVTGTGFPPLLKVRLSFADQPVGGDISANNKGKFEANFQVPPSKPGSAEVVANSPIGIGASATFTVTVTNHPPVAHDLSVSTMENSKVDVKLSADDPDGDPLTFTAVDGPHHGTLTGDIAAGTATYTPAANFSGSDSFTFKANDGKVDSNVATASIDVVQVNRPPTTSNQVASVREGETTNVTLVASDPDGDPLTFSIVTQPLHGTLAGTPPNMTYRPADNYYGDDSFMFKANDGRSDSNISTVGISVIPVSRPPVASSEPVAVNEDASVTIKLSASSSSAQSVDFTIATSPAHGTLGPVTRTGPMSATVLYRPAANYNGHDSFTFTATDGSLTSSPAIVDISVLAVNHAPVAGDVRQSLGGASWQVALNATDADGDNLTFSIVSGPEKGTLGQIVQSGPSSATVVYTPNPDQSGPDSFTFKANDGKVDSNVATAFLTVEATAASRQPAPAENPQPVPHTPSKEDQNISQRLSIRDRVSTDLSVAPSTQANAGTDEKSTGASFGPNMWLLIGSVAGAGAIAAFLVYRRRTSGKVLEGPEEFGPQDPPADSAADMMAVNTGEQTPVMEEARRIFRMLNDEKSVAARKQMYDVAFGRTPPDGSYEHSKALVKGQFKQIGHMVMSDPLLNAMFMDSFAKVTIKVWRVLADEIEREMQSDRGLEPLARLGKDAERYWLEHNREPIEVY